MLIAMAVHNDVRRDARVIKEATSLRAAGHDVRIYGLTTDESTEDFTVGEHQVPVRLVYRVEPASGFDPLHELPGLPAKIAKLFGFYMRAKLTSRADRIRRSFSYQGALLAGAIVRELKPDAVHLHDHVSFTAAPVYKETLGVPITWDAHEIYQELASGDEERTQASAAIIRENAPLADHFVTINESIARFYAGLDIGLPPATVLPNASMRSDALAYDGRLHALTGLPRERRILLFQGGLGRHRGVEQLVRAAQSLNDEWSVVLMGWGPLRAELEAEASNQPKAHDGTPRVVFIDGVPQAELPHWTAGATLGAIPYENNCLNHLYCTPNKLWEYPLAGVPILASDLEEMGPVIREHGIGALVPREFTSDDIAARVNELDTDALATMRTNCARYAETNHWGAFDDRLTAVYAGFQGPVRTAKGARVVGFTALDPSWRERSDLRRSASGAVRKLRRALRLGRYSSARSTGTLSTADTDSQRKLAGLERTLAVERARTHKLKETVADVRKRYKELGQQHEELRKRYRDVRIDKRDILPIEHNTAQTMDVFFAKEESDTPYEEFAVALAKFMGQKGLDITGKSILDVGVGPGTMLAALIKNQSPASIRGLDFSAVAVERARARMPEGSFEVASIYEPIEERADLVLCTEVLEHLEEPELAIRNVLSAIAPGGVAVLTVPDGRVDYSLYHINFWSPESWDAFVRGNAENLRYETGRFRVRETSSYANNVAVVHRPSS